VFKNEYASGAKEQYLVLQLQPSGEATTTRF